MNQVLKLLVPWDFSDHSKAALSYACRHFRGEAIKVLCVLEPPNIYAPGFNWGPEAESKAAEECRNEFREHSNVPADSSVEFQVLFGNPATEICRFADEAGADYIVMSTHGRTGLKQIFIGSVAQNVIANSKTPVLMLPSKWFDNLRSVRCKTEQVEA